MSYQQEKRVASEENRFGGIATMFDLDNENDRRVVKAFEHELEPYFQRLVIVEQEGKGRSRTAVEITGLELYMHEKDIFVFSRKYPFGAVRNPEQYRITRLKWQAVKDLRMRREAIEANKPTPIGA